MQMLLGLIINLYMTTVICKVTDFIITLSLNKEVGGNMWKYYVNRSGSSQAVVPLYTVSIPFLVDNATLH